MKSILRFKSLAVIFCLSLSLGAALAQMNPAGGAPAPGAIDPTTGMPMATMTITTGMPAAITAPEWKDPNWKDPDIILTNVSYDNFPLGEIARNLSSAFKEQFDVLLPAPSSGTAINRLNGLLVSDIDWKDTAVQLRLKNVSASEIFNAMNIIFENDQTPLRWELKVNGRRQIALLRVLVDRSPQVAPPPRDEMRRIYFIGELIGDEKSGGMSIDQIIKTITDVWSMADTMGATIQFHKEAQLLVVRGSPAQIDFMEQTLKALRQKIELARRAQSKAKPEEANAGAPLKK